jgi:hypothetical protein
MLVNILDMEWCLILPSITKLSMATPFHVAILLKGKVQILVLNRERNKESFGRADLWL